MVDLGLFLSGFSSEIVLTIVFLLLILCGLGLPFPEELLLLTAGYLAYRRIIVLEHAIMVPFVGILLGDLLLFNIGSRMGLTIFRNRWFRRMVHRERLRLSRDYFDQHGTRIVFVARFITGLRAPIFLSAAILRMRLSKFFLIDFFAAIISVPLIVYVAYRFGDKIELFAQLLKNTKISLFAIGVLALITIFGYTIYRKRRTVKDARE